MVPMSDSNNQLTLYKKHIHVIHKYKKVILQRKLGCALSSNRIIKGFVMVREMLSTGQQKKQVLSLYKLTSTIHKCFPLKLVIISFILYDSCQTNSSYLLFLSFQQPTSILFPSSESWCLLFSHFKVSSSSSSILGASLSLSPFHSNWWGFDQSAHSLLLRSPTSQA